MVLFVLVIVWEYFFAMHFPLLWILEMFQWLAKLGSRIFPCSPVEAMIVFSSHRPRYLAAHVPLFVSFALFLLFYCVGGLDLVFITSTPYYWTIQALHLAYVTCVSFITKLSHKNMAVFLFSSWMCSNLDIYTQEQARDIILRNKMPARTCFQQSVDY